MTSSGPLEKEFKQYCNADDQVIVPKSEDKLQMAVN